jgi:hypothetical protein
MPTINATVTDSQGRKSSKSFHLAASVTTVAGAQSAWDDILAAWPGVSDGGLDSPMVSFPLTGAAIAPVAGSNIDEKSKFTLAMATGVGDENYPVPCPPRTAGEFDFIDGGQVDIADAGVVAWFALFATGDVLRIGVNSLRAVSSVRSGYLEK